MRTIVLPGTRRWPRSQCWRTNSTRPTAVVGGWRCTGCSRNGAFCVFTSSVQASSHVRSDQRLGRRTRRARRGGAAGPAAWRPCGSRRAAARSRRRRRWRPRRRWPPRPARGPPGRRVGSPRSMLAARATVRRRRRRARRASPTSRPRSLPRRSSSPSAGSSRARRRPGATQGVRRAPGSAAYGVVVEQAAEAAQAEHDRLPHGEVALAAEALDEREEVRRRQAAGDDRVPRVVDEVVALERVERRRARRR